ncbi:BnaC06g04070D [Brassica napus]|uniref:BnaC06g04070D protein n=1 Tax=Brassica napus TaxID=3708 RepID=A0A078GJ19_BRANA|nr:BnaC06g04070D [Brassica napus]
MVLPSGNRRPSRSREKNHLLKPCFTTSQPTTLPPLTDLKALSLSVSFNGWRFPNVKFKSWATKMSALHEPTWKKAGILQAVAASTLKIIKDTDLVLGVAEKWCPDTNTFVFPWGEATVTLEDVMVLLGFSVLGSPVFAALDSSGEKILRELEKEWVKIKRDRVSFVTQVAWMGRFMDSGDDEDELEHVAFLVLWLSYFVFSSRYYHIDEAVLPIAVHLSEGLYLLTFWTWERFRELRPKPNLLLQGQPRLARWDDVEQGDTDVRQILDNSKMDTMWVPVGPDLDEEFISFARCIKVSELVGGMNCVEHYFPNGVASQFGLLQDVPCLVNRNNLSEEEAWNEYDKPIEDLTLFIPSRSAELGLVRADENETVQPPEKEQRNEETRQTCDDELDVHGRNVEKMSMPDDGSKEPECLLHEDGGMAGEKASSEKKENDSLIQKKIASNADNNEPTPYQNLAPGGSEVAGESKRNEDVGDETVLGSEEPLKSSEKLEKRNEDVGGGNDSYEKSLHNVKKLASSIEGLALSIDEGIAKAERNVAWLKAMRAAKQKKIAAARLI